MSAQDKASASVSSSVVDCPVIDLRHSPFASLTPVSITNVKLEDNFWRPRIDLNRTVTIPSQLQHCKDTGRIENFLRAAGRSDAAFQGIFFNDSDVYKWAEAAAFSLATHPDPALDAELDAVIEIIGAAQQPDGYLNTYFMFERESERYTNLKDMHEIYCAGHLIQAAVAHHRATGKTTFLNIACRLADHLYLLFGPGQRVGACGHEEAEMALVELYRETRVRDYLELANCMVDARGGTPPMFGNSAYHQDHLPFIKQTELVGHAVRHLYYVCGATDVASELPLKECRAALDSLWSDLTLRKMYVTGGAGSRYEGEAFGAAYELPNDRAYTETCAAIASVMWNWRLLNMTGESRYADLMEHTLYNAVLPGVSLDATRYYYQNPLSDGGSHRRKEWFGCACCPPNVARLLASLTGYFYSTASSGLYVHLYGANSARIAYGSGHIDIQQKTEYPWNGEIVIEAALTGIAKTEIHLRIPDWAIEPVITIDGETILIDENSCGSYFAVPITDGKPVEITLALPMPVECIVSHTRVVSNSGKIALKRGPLIYCVEQADFATETADIRDLFLPDDADLETEFRDDLLGGLCVITGEALASPPTSVALYSRYQPDEMVFLSPVPLTAIPYYAWANREAGPMQVWIPTLPALVYSEEDEDDEE